MRYVVILAGGAGTRLWPLSRFGMPKQLLKLFSNKSLLQLAFERLKGIVPTERIIICTSGKYIDEVQRQLPALRTENQLSEPCGRDSLNAAAWSNAELLRRDKDAVVAIVTADQIIQPVESFQKALNKAFEVAELNAKYLVTLGVIPDSAHTGYGYLHKGKELTQTPGVYELLEFREKPPVEVAQQYYESGQYWWNSGMFVWQAKTFDEQLSILAGKNKELIDQMVADPNKITQIYPQLPKNSIDYAIMEPVSVGEGTASIVAVPLPIEWRDLGGFESLVKIFACDEDKNRISGVAVNLDSSGCFIINTTDRPVATIGLHDHLIVQTPDATLISPLNQSQRVKELVELVKLNLGDKWI